MSKFYLASLFFLVSCLLAAQGAPASGNQAPTPRAFFDIGVEYSNGLLLESRFSLSRETRLNLGVGLDLQQSYYMAAVANVGLSYEIPMTPEFSFEPEFLLAEAVMSPLLDSGTYWRTDVQALGQVNCYFLKTLRAFLGAGLGGRLLHQTSGYGSGGSKQELIFPLKVGVSYLW